MPHLNEIGKYQVQDVLGEGAMGVVYRALDPVLNRHVAIKVMSDALAQDMDLRERFLREAQAAGSLQHPHVVTIYDFGEVDGHPFIAMEYVEGVDLEHLLRTNVPLSIDEKLELAIGVLQGLAYAHRKGIIHRDIKPGNIRVDSDGKARIMDFGIAHITSSNMTRTGVMLGTPNYMAPEQIVGHEITARTDIFSVGVLLYELLTNAKPFQGDTLHTVMYKVLSEMPPPLDKVLPGLPPSLNTVVMRALQKDPAQRYASALEMANDLTTIRAALTDAPAAKTLSLRRSIETALATERQARLSVERRTKYALAAAAVLVILVVGAASLFVHGGSDGSFAARVDSNAAPASVPPSSSARPATSSPGTQTGASPESTAVRQTASSQRETAARSDSAPPAPPPSKTPARETVGERAGRRTAGAPVVTQGRTDTSPVSAASRPQSQQSKQRQQRAASPPRDTTSSGVDQRTVTDSAPTVTRSTAQQPPPVTAPVSASVPPAQPSSTTKTAPLTPPADPAAEIATLAAAYARAIESRDVAALRRLYPEMVPARQQAFKDFFAYTRSLKATLSVSELQVDGTSAEATLTGVYEFVTNAGREERQPVTFHATLHKAGGSWRFASIR